MVLRLAGSAMGNVERGARGYEGKGREGRESNVLPSVRKGFGSGHGGCPLARRSDSGGWCWARTNRRPGGGRGTPACQRARRAKFVQGYQRPDLPKRRAEVFQATTSRSDVRRTGRIVALREATEAPLATVGPHPGRCWNPWEVTPIDAVDTARSGLLRVRYGDPDDPGFPVP